MLSGFEVPYNWAVEVTYQSHDALALWRGQGPRSLGNKPGGYLCSSKTWYPDIPEGFTEMTFDEFRQYVLGEPLFEGIDKAITDCDYLIEIFNKLNIT